MKNNLKDLGLTGLAILATASPSFAQKRDKSNSEQREYIENTIHDVKYSDKTLDKKFALEEQVLFGKYDANDIPRIFVPNNNHEKGELSFIVYLENQAELQINGGKISIIGTSYIPTRLVNTETNSIVKNFELKNINARVKKDLNKKLKESKKHFEYSENSENSYGYKILLTEEDFKFNFPKIELPNGEVYVCINNNWGEFYDDKKRSLEVELKEKTLNEFYLPLINGKCMEIIETGNGKMYIRSENGFYVPARNEAQIEFNYPSEEPINPFYNENTSIQKENIPDKESNSIKESPAKKSDYIKYREQIEREQQRKQFSGKSSTKAINSNNRR